MGYQALAFRVAVSHRTAEGPVLTEIGKPMLGVECGKNLPARMAGCSSSNDWPLAYAGGSS